MAVISSLTLAFLFTKEGPAHTAAARLVDFAAFGFTIAFFKANTPLSDDLVSFFRVSFVIESGSDQKNNGVVGSKEPFLSLQYWAI